MRLVGDLSQKIMFVSSMQPDAVVIHKLCTSLPSNFRIEALSALSVQSLQLPQRGGVTPPASQKGNAFLGN